MSDEATPQATPSGTPSDLSVGLKLFFHVYPYGLFLFGAAAAARFFILFLQIYNPSLSFFPARSRLVEVMAFSAYLLPLLGWWGLKRLFTRSEQSGAAWRAYEQHCNNPALSDDERLGGSRYSRAILIMGVLFFLSFTAYFIFTADLSTSAEAESGG